MAGSGVTTIQTGLPFNVTISPDQAGIGVSGSQRPNLVGTAIASGGARTQFLNPAAFAIPAAGAFGNLGAYAIYQPLFANWDVSVQKAFPIGERVRASLRAELYNFPETFLFHDDFVYGRKQQFRPGDRCHRSPDFTTGFAGELLSSEQVCYSADGTTVRSALFRGRFRRAKIGAIRRVESMPRLGRLPIGRTERLPLTTCSTNTRRIVIKLS